MSISLLLVDDHQLIRLGLRVSLEKMPDFVIVGEAENGSTAIERALELKPQVILMDIGMPGVDGIEAAREIKAALPEAKVLMLTTHDQDDDVFAALSAGADGYCLKDSSNELLIGAIYAVNSGAAWLDPGIARRVIEASKSEPSSTKTLASKHDKFALSPREAEVLELLVDGLSNQLIAERLFISNETVKTHMRHIMEKLVVSDRTQAAVKALKEGLCKAKVGNSGGVIGT